MAVDASLWGDSIGKGVVYDETRGRYVILKENCVTLLSDKLGARIANHAVMGCTARKALDRLNDQDLCPGGLAVFEFGGNDCDMPWKEISGAPEGDYQPNTPLPEFKRVLTELVERVKAAGMRTLLVTPPPLVAERYFDWVSRNLNPSAILAWLGDVQHIYRWQERYAAAVRDVAQKTGAGLMDLRDAFLLNKSIDSFYCVDGIHPNERGHRLLCEAAFDQLGAVRG